MKPKINSKIARFKFALAIKVLELNQKFRPEQWTPENETLLQMAKEKLDRMNKANYYG